jgi:hypothetical protein
MILVVDKNKFIFPLINDLLCRLESLNNIFNPSSNLILYPSQQTIASITNIWSPFRNLFFNLFYFIKVILMY